MSLWDGCKLTQGLGWYRCVVKSGLVIVLALSMIGRGLASPISMNDAFSALTSATRPGIYQAQARGYMTGGGLSVHFPKKSAHLVDVSSPHYSAGCGGVDIYTGGLSYISGEQFISLLKGIAANAMGYSFSLAMRTLCPVCASTVASLQKIAQSANQLAIHQCQFAMGLVDPATPMQARARAINMAALDKANSGKVSDFIAGIHAIGGSVAKAIEAVADSLKHIEQQSVQDQKVQESQYGSTTWKLLSGLSVSQKLLIQSLLGSVTRYPYPAKHPDSIVLEPVSASMSIDELADLFIYGANAVRPNNAKLWLNACVNRGEQGNLFSKKGIPICEHIVRQPIKKSQWYHHANTSVYELALKRYGFFGMTYSLLFQALQNIREGHPLAYEQDVVLPAEIYGADVHLPGSFKRSEIQAFISIVPLPIYRAMNIAAVYPEVAEALVHNIAEIVAMEYAIQFINRHVLNTQEAGNSVQGHIGLSEQRLQQLQKTLAAMQGRLHRRAKAVLSHINVTQAWVNQVNQIQSQLYTQTLVSKLNANNISSR